MAGVRSNPLRFSIVRHTVHAKTRSEEFIRFLAKWEKKKNSAKGTEAQLDQIARARVICVISNVSSSEYKSELDNIEETNPIKWEAG